MALGTTGLAAAVTLIMVLAPASGGIVSRSTVLTPAYKGTVSQPGSDISTSGCAKAKLTTAHWNAKTGLVTLADSGAAVTCGKSLGYVGGSSSAFAESYIEVAIPIHAAHNGNNTIATAWSVNIASSSTFSAPACPAKNVNYHPGLYQSSYAYCEAGAEYTVEISSSVQDLSNSSWYSNSSYVEAYNDSYMENYTDCYNYGTPTCYNYSYSNSYHASYGYNTAGVASFTPNGASSVIGYDNGTKMVRSHHYVLTFEVFVYVDDYAEKQNLLGPWAASGASTINLATLGNGATLTSVSIS
jgi:hypothetical protein